MDNTNYTNDVKHYNRDDTRQHNKSHRHNNDNRQEYRNHRNNDDKDNNNDDGNEQKTNFREKYKEPEPEEVGNYERESDNLPESVDDFEDWVCDNGDKREAYVWKHKDKYIICGWCAC